MNGSNHGDMLLIIHQVEIPIHQQTHQLTQLLIQLLIQQQTQQFHLNQVDIMTVN